MAWTAPMTAVAGTAFTAAQFNQYVRDNLLETAPAKATTAGQVFVSTAANAIAARLPSYTWVPTSQTTTSNSYVDLTTPGPAVTVTTGTQAIVFIACNTGNSNTNSCFMSFAVSGASTIAADDSFAVTVGGVTGVGLQASYVVPMIITPGSNTFTAKYRVAGTSTGTFLNRRIFVFPL